MKATNRSNRAPANTAMCLATTLLALAVTPLNAIAKEIGAVGVTVGEAAVHAEAKKGGEAAAEPMVTTGAPVKALVGPAEKSKESDPNTVVVDLASIKPEPPLMAWRFTAGASMGCADCTGGKGDGMFGLALRMDLGPTATDGLAPYFEVGLRTYKQATYLDLGFVPTFWLDIGIPKYWFIAASPVLGVSLADIENNLGGSDDRLHYGRRFQYQGGGEVGLWYAWTETQDRVLNEPVLNRMGELANDYRNQCLAEGIRVLPACQALANELNRLRTELVSRGSSQCQIATEVTTGEAGNRKVALDVLDSIEVCHFLARERRNNETPQTKVGGALRLTHTGGRGLPSVNALELSLGVAL